MMFLWDKKIDKKWYRFCTYQQFSQTQTPKIFKVPFLREPIFFEKTKTIAVIPPLCLFLAYVPLLIVYGGKRLTVDFFWYSDFHEGKTIQNNKASPLTVLNFTGSADSERSCLVLVCFSCVKLKQRKIKRLLFVNCYQFKSFIGVISRRFWIKLRLRHYISNFFKTHCSRVHYFILNKIV